MRRYKDNLIVKMSFQFALDVIEFSDLLRTERRYAIADQVLRSGCSIGANIREAQGSESKADFIHKLKLASKEAEETEYWLELCNSAVNYPKPGKLLVDIEGILKVINKVIATTKRKVNP
jgi:four helix bundle protein